MQEKSPDRIVTLALVDEVHSLAIECLSIRCLGALEGPPGVGKTVALQSVERRLNTPDHPTRCLYYRAFPSDGHTRCVRDLLETLGIRTHIMSAGMTLQTLIRMALKELRARHIEMIMVDEADHWSTEGLQGFVSLLDAAKHDQHPLGAVLCGNSEMHKWLAQYAAGLSRTLRCSRAESLSMAMMLAVLREWGAEFEGLADAVGAGDKAARQQASAIFKATSGNLRRLNFYARLHQLHFAGVPASDSTHQALLPKLLQG